METDVLLLSVYTILTNEKYMYVLSTGRDSRDAKFILKQPHTSERDGNKSNHEGNCVVEIGHESKVITKRSGTIVCIPHLQHIFTLHILRGTCTTNPFPFPFPLLSAFILREQGNKQGCTALI